MKIESCKVWRMGGHLIVANCFDEALEVYRYILADDYRCDTGGFPTTPIDPPTTKLLNAGIAWRKA